MRNTSTHSQTEQAKRLRESGLTYREIASHLGIDKSIAYRMCTIPGYPNKTGNKGIDVERAIELRKAGTSCIRIAEILGCTRDAVYKNTSSVLTKEEKPRKVTKLQKRTYNFAKILEMRDKGFSCTYIAEKLGVSKHCVYVNLRKAGYNNSSQRSLPIYKELRMPRKKKKVDAPQPMVDRYANLQKGLEKGVKEIVTTLREDRDQGYTNSFKYKDEYSTKPITIFVKDGASREESANRWCEKNKKTFVSLI